MSRVVYICKSLEPPYGLTVWVNKPTKYYLDKTKEEFLFKAKEQER